MPAPIHDLQLCFLPAAVLVLDLGFSGLLLGLIQVWAESGLIWFLCMWISSFVGMNVLPQLCILGPGLFLSYLSLPLSPSVSMPVLCNFDYHSLVMYLEMMNMVFPGLSFFLRYIDFQVSLVVLYSRLVFLPSWQTPLGFWRQHLT